MPASSRDMPKVICVRSLVPKLKNSRHLGDLVGRERRARDLDHGADHVVDLHAALGEHLGGHGAHRGDLVVELLLGADQRDHDLGVHVDALGLDVAGGLEDGARLHAGDLRVDDAQAAAAQAEHGVVLVQVVDLGGHVVGRDAQLSATSS